MKRAAREGRPDSSCLIGLMSGTSHDGVDAALVRFATGKTPELICHTHTPYAPALRRRIRAVLGGGEGGGAASICALSFELGRVFGACALACARKARFDIRRVAAIASHGQTVYHISPTLKSPGSTLQIGNPAVIASVTGRPVVSDFRSADMAAGGQGAPLVPRADRIMFHDPRIVRAVHNLGGISNVTVLPRAMRAPLRAFDTGPGNCLMDEAMRRLYKKEYDRGGLVARSGRPDGPTLRNLLSLGYFRKEPPKSTGRELFGPALLERMVYGRGLRRQDVVSTLTHLSAVSIGRAYREFVLPRHKVAEVVFAGGGARNGYLMELIEGELKGMVVRASEEFGVPSEAREAMAFAVLGYESMQGRPGNEPSATGARRAVVLGSWTPAGL